MAGYEVCQHCSNSVRASKAVFKDGYSYHRSCRKCYVCSETNLQGAEVFRGVIFCASCAKRIFKGCATARVAKQPVRRRRAREPRGVIERARAAPSTSSLSSTPHSKTDAAVPIPVRDPRVSHDCYCVSDVVTQAKKLINFIYFQTHNLARNNKADIAQCSEVCKRMLEDLCPPSELRQESTEQSQTKLARRNSTPLKISSACSTSCSHSRSKGRERKSKKLKKEANPCSDLRIAELGASIEIATMALRKTSTKKVPSESKVTQEAEEPETISMFSNIDSVSSHTSNEEYLDSECQEYRGSKESDGSVFDRTFASIMKIPFKNFKKNIIERSSLISVIAEIDTEKNYRSAFKRLKTLFHDDVLEHQSNGYKKLYPSINKKATPYKLGWLELDETGDRKTCPCKHYAECHSYRCMREQVMRLAGPTQSKMYVYRSKMKKIVPPFLKKVSIRIRREHCYPDLVPGRHENQRVMTCSFARSSRQGHQTSQERTEAVNSNTEENTLTTANSMSKTVMHNMLRSAVG